MKHARCDVRLCPSMPTSKFSETKNIYTAKNGLHLNFFIESNYVNNNSYLAAILFRHYTKK